MLARISIRQKRKYTGAPYYVHTEAVYHRLKELTNDHVILIAALWHDVLEDVYPRNRFFGPFLIRLLFGKEVLKVVRELTDRYTKVDYPLLNRQERHELEVKRLALVSELAKIVKLCDLIDNTADIAENDPNFAITYLKEKRHLIPFLLVKGNSLNQYLFDIAKKQVDSLSLKLNIYSH